jgi:flagellar assembly protein FliH
MNGPATMLPAHDAAAVPDGTPSVSAFDLPAFPPLAAVRDRAQEAAERTTRLREDGYAAGYQAGLDAAAREIERDRAEHRQAAQRLSAAAAALEAAARNLNARDQVSLDELEREAVALGVSLATELVGRELAVTDTPVVDALRRAVALVPDRGVPVVRVHPADDETTREAIAADILGWSGDVSVVADPGVEPGGCVVDVGPCRIDAQIGPAIERLRAVSAAV